MSTLLFTEVSLEQQETISGGNLKGINKIKNIFNLISVVKIRNIFKKSRNISKVRSVVTNSTTVVVHN